MNFNQYRELADELNSALSAIERFAGELDGENQEASDLLTAAAELLEQAISQAKAARRAVFAGEVQ